MNNKKSFIIGIGIVLLVGIFSLVIVIFSNNKKPDVSIDKDESVTITSKDFNKLNNNMYFTIQSIINDYYEINSNSDNVGYIARNIYYYNKDGYGIYLVSGYLINQDYVDSDVSFTGNVNYELILDLSKKTYNIKKIDGNDYALYLDNYYFKGVISVVDGLTYKESNVSVTSKLSMYIGEFINLLYVNSEYAYNLLGNSTKGYYENYSNFVNNIEDLFNRLTPVIFSYSSSEKDGVITYNVRDDNGNEIVITEKNIMDYKLDINIQ